jgi:hypothetical protein
VRVGGVTGDDKSRVNETFTVQPMLQLIGIAGEGSAHRSTIPDRFAPEHLFVFFGPIVVHCGTNDDLSRH